MSANHKKLPTKLTASYALMQRLSTTRVTNKVGAWVTLWFDTEPNSYREIRITPKITDDQKKQVIDEMANEREIEERRKSILASVGDPRWNEEEHGSQPFHLTAHLIKQYHIHVRGNMITQVRARKCHEVQPHQNEGLQ